MFGHIFQKQNEVTNVRDHYTRYLTTSFFAYILGANGIAYQIEDDSEDPRKKEISCDAVYYHFRKWSRDGSLERMCQASIMTIAADLNLSELNLDGSHTIAKKGVESVAYQGRKKAKTTNILPITDGQGFIIATTGLIAGNHNDAYNLKSHLQVAFKSMKRLGLNIQGSFFNADKAFDTHDALKTYFNHG